MIKALVIESNDENREDLLWNLKFFCGFEIINEMKSFEDLELLPPDTEFDVAFVSLELPTSDGFYCSYYLQKNFPDVKIIMMSESKDLAFEAYEYGLFDYILKPLEPSRVEKTIWRLNEALRPEEAIIESPKSIMVKMKGRYQMIGFDDILFLEMRAKKCYMILQNGKEVLLQRYTMEQLEKMFEPFGFYRCYQSVIVQISKIVQLMAEAESRNFTILLKDYNEKIPVSRDKFSQIVGMLQEISGITVTGNGKYE